MGYQIIYLSIIYRRGDIMNNNELSFFASANSGRGFVNFYGDIFNGLDKHYIIKGGPGTGKSSLMKAIAYNAEKKGMTVQRFHCSSDPDSLDGIIINELSVAMSDGTPPHSADPHCPGVTDEIIDLSSFWDKNILAKSRDLIVTGTQKKTQLYKNVYSYLKAALEIDRIKQRTISAAVDKRSLRTLARAYTDVTAEQSSRASVRLVNGITMKGYYELSPYKNNARIIYNVKNTYGAGYLFLDQIRNYLIDNEMIISYDALDTEKINMIYLPTHRILFCMNGNCGKEIDTDRYISGDIDILKKVDERKAEIMSEAYLLLSEIELQHFSLEKIYISAMDFDRKEEYQEKLIKEILS